MNLQYSRPIEQQLFPPPDHKPNYDDHRNQMAVTSSMNEIRYPPGYNDHRYDNLPHNHLQHGNNQFYRIRQNIRGGKLLRFINNMHYVGKLSRFADLSSARLCNVDFRVCAN